ncbi:deoxyuridine 5'-triphosphate nucleotidohydrolase-like [Falco naumanni]|uniref:deoxyuridine 5'-triphosphate nucleotidohydrolase-like n=1 Tax=Falco naumanni TaxID=148594 RepID=UPI001ADE5878|nr:deoxyuridine 5'-triphosphate nucleotidohydrolase-like [Falco naumanni]
MIEACARAPLVEEEEKAKIHANALAVALNNNKKRWYTPLCSGKRERPRSEGRGQEISPEPNKIHGCLGELYSATRGSAGVDLAVAEPVNITDEKVHVLPSTVSGPLGYGLSALLIGRSSASNKGIFVLPGCIDADYTGPIGIMVKVFSPPVHIPAGSTIAQLIPFQATVPQKGEKDRGQGAFGSTGMPNIAFCQLIGAERPKCNVKISGPQGVKLPNVSMMIDTGADVTVLPFSVWPTMWELDSAGSTISGIGGSRLTQGQ